MPKVLVSRFLESINRSFPLTEGTLGHTFAISGISLGYIADCVMQDGLLWNEKEIALKDLWLSRTNPIWDAIIVNRCSRSAENLKDFIESNPQDSKIFPDQTFCDLPILVKFEGDKYKVLDGMKRVIAAIKTGRSTIGAFVSEEIPLPKKFPEGEHKCEARVIYSLLNAYQLGINKDKDALIAALRFLRQSYDNVSYLLRHRFSESWFQGAEMKEVIEESLKD